MWGTVGVAYQRCRGVRDSGCSVPEVLEVWRAHPTRSPNTSVTARVTEATTAPTVKMVSLGYHRITLEKYRFFYFFKL